MSLRTPSAAFRLVTAATLLVGSGLAFTGDRDAIAAGLVIVICGLFTVAVASAVREVIRERERAAGPLAPYTSRAYGRIIETALLFIVTLPLVVLGAIPLADSL